MSERRDVADAYMHLPVEWKSADDGSNTVEGYASVFDVVDLHRDVVKRGAFRKTLKERVPAGMVKLLDSHIPDSSHVLGTVVEAKEDRTGLWFRARLSSAPSVQDIKTKMLEGHLDKLSIGYTTVKDSWHEDDDGSPVHHLDEVKLFEVSVVPFPANEDAAILAVKNAVSAASGHLNEVDDDRKRDIAEHMADSLKGVLGSEVTLIVGSTPDDVKAALDARDDADDGDLMICVKGARGQDPDVIAEMAADAAREAVAAEHNDSPPVGVEDPEPDAVEPKHEKPSLEEILRRAKAELEDRDPDEVAEPTQVASLTTRIDLEERRLRELLPEQESDTL